MQGLLNSGMNAEEGARPQKMPRGGQQPRPQQGGQRGRPQEGRQAPEQAGQNGVDMDPEVAEEQRNTLVNAMLQQLYGPQLDRSAEMLNRNASEPVQGIGKIVSGLLGASYKSLKDEGRSVPPGVMFQAGMMASQAVGEMAMRMGVIDESNEADTVESGFMLGLGEFGRANAKEMGREERARYGDLIDKMEEGKQMAMGGNNANRPESTGRSNQPMPRGGA